MTVEELIEALSDMPLAAEVYTDRIDGENRITESVESATAYNVGFMGEKVILEGRR